MAELPSSNRDLLAAVGRYWDTRSEGYAEQVDREQQENAFAAYREAFEGIAPAARVLDVGCGPGFFATELAKAGFAVTALDYSDGMLEKARQRAAACGVAVDFVQGDAEHLPFETGSFALVCSRNVLWNLPHPEAALAEWLRVLALGGRLVCFDGNHYRWLFDERYRQVHQDWEKTVNHVFLGVPTTPIDTIARDLPLGARQRPEWDTATLEKLGAECVQSRVLGVTATQDGQELTQSFVVTAQKPF